MLLSHNKQLLNLKSHVVSLQISSMASKICTGPHTIMLKMVMLVISMALLLSRELLVCFHEASRT